MLPAGDQTEIGEKVNMIIFVDLITEDYWPDNMPLMYHDIALGPNHANLEIFA